MTGAQLAKLNRPILIAELLRAGESLQSVADKVGLSYRRTSYIAKSHGLIPPSSSWPSIKLNNYFQRGSDTECWPWTGTIRKGYGRYSIHGSTVNAHRAVYEQERGPIPFGYVLHHKCRNRACVNPAHLQPLERFAHGKLHGAERIN